MNHQDASIYSRVLRYVTKFDTAIDVGAHAGEWTNRMYADFGSVHAFEPNCTLYHRLAHRFSGELLSRVNIHDVALLDVIGRGKLACHDGSNDKMRGFYATLDNDGDVDVRTLDSFRIRGCGLLKIDVEGGELRVLQGARRMLRHQRPVVVVECKSVQASRFGWTRNDLYLYLVQLGYRIAFVNRPNVVFVHNNRSG